MLRHARSLLTDALPGTSALAGAFLAGASRLSRHASFIVRGGDPVPAAGLLALNTLRDNPGSTKQARRVAIRAEVCGGTGVEDPLYSRIRAARAAKRAPSACWQCGCRRATALIVPPFFSPLDSHSHVPCCAAQESRQRHRVGSRKDFGEGSQGTKGSDGCVAGARPPRTADPVVFPPPVAPHRRQTGTEGTLRPPTNHQVGCAASAYAQGTSRTSPLRAGRLRSDDDSRSAASSTCAPRSRSSLLRSPSPGYYVVLRSSHAAQPRW